MLFTISGYGGSDDGITIEVNGTQIGFMSESGGITPFGPYTANINIGDILDIYNYDSNTPPGTCWAPGFQHFDISYNSGTWAIDWSSDYSYCLSIEQCMSVGWSPSQYPALLLRYRLDATGPVRIDSERFDCLTGNSSSSQSISESSFSSSSSSSTEEEVSSGSSSSTEFLANMKGVTYYSDFIDMNSINNPTIGGSAKMQFYGFWDKEWGFNTLSFDNFGHGLKKTRNNQGVIFCEDASKLFATNNGYVGMILSFPKDIVNGIYKPLLENTSDYDEHILWGINIGQYEHAEPSLYAALTPSGIEFTLWNSDTQWTIRDAVSNISAGTDVFLEFAWGEGHNEVTLDPINLMIIRVNDENIVVSNPPTVFNNLTTSKFYALDTPYLTSDLECTIKKMVIYDKIPETILPLFSTSSSSSS